MRTDLLTFKSPYKAHASYSFKEKGPPFGPNAQKGKEKIGERAYTLLVFSAHVQYLYSYSLLRCSINIEIAVRVYVNNF